MKEHDPRERDRAAALAEDSRLVASVGPSVDVAEHSVSDPPLVPAWNVNGT